MSRNLKFKKAEVALWTKEIDGVDEVDTMQHFAVILDYRRYKNGTGQYKVQRVLHPLNGAAYGQTAWVWPEKLFPLRAYPRRPMAGRLARANERLAERGCVCNCCAHEAIPRGMVRGDGTFTWDDTEPGEEARLERRYQGL